MFIALVWAVFGPVCPTGESQRRKVHAYEFRLQNSTAPLYGKREAARQAGPRRGPDRALPPPPGRVSASLSLDLVLSYMGTAAALTDTLAARAVTAATTRPRWVLSEQLRGRGRAGERRLPRVGGDAPRPTDVAVKPTKADRAGSLQDERRPPPVSQQISGAGTRVSMSRRDSASCVGPALSITASPPVVTLGLTRSSALWPRLPGAPGGGRRQPVAPGASPSASPELSLLRTTPTETQPRPAAKLTVWSPNP